MPIARKVYQTMNLSTLQHWNLGQKIGQLRAWRLRLAAGAPPAFLVAYAADFDVDPWEEMFYWPTDTLKLALLTVDGRIAWTRDLGRGVPPGAHFCPVHAADLDGDGVDEVWYVDNAEPVHPLSLRGRRLRTLDGRTGELLGEWPWPRTLRPQTMSHTYRGFIFSGRVGGKTVLVTAQGTYEDMHLQGWRAPGEECWRLDIAADAPGARGAHAVAVVDLNGDGNDEALWGERLVDLATGRQLWCADEDSYRGHSDVVKPFFDPDRRTWYVYTCREGDGKVSPRVALFDADGRRVWGAVDHGHMDMGWVARMGDSGFTAMAIRIGAKTCGPDGRHHTAKEAFGFDALTGEPRVLPFDPYGTIPVDFDGDGRDEFVQGAPVGDQHGCIFDRFGIPIANVAGSVALTGAFAGGTREQALVYRPDGTVVLVGEECEGR
jgi:hypothetical protein